MIWIVIALVVITIFASISAWGSDYGRWGDFFGTFFIGCIIAVLPVVVANALAYDSVSVKEDRYLTLENLGDGAGVSGSFFLGGGSIDTEPVYMYYVEENGQYRLYHQQAAYSYITYTEDTPTLVFHGSRSGNMWLSLKTWWGMEEYNGGYEFRVPRGSVKQNFNLDAQ